MSLDFLFIPVSGSPGTGESSKALQFVEALKAEDASVHCKVVLAAQSPLLASAGDHGLSIAGAPTKHSAEVNALIEQLRPRVVIFDSTSRVAQLRAARRASAKVVYIGPRPSAIKRGFSWRRLRHFDEYWVATPAMLGGRLSAWQRLKVRLSANLRLRFFDGFFLDPAIPADAEQAKCGPIVFCPGGRDFDTMFGVAAAQVAARTGLNCTVLLARPELAPAAPGLTILPRQNNRVLLELVQSARHVVSNGGDFLIQLLCLGHAPVCAPLSSDQGPRIRELQQHGNFVRGVPAQLDAIVEAVCDDLAQPEALSARRANVRALAWRNGMSEAVRVLLVLREGGQP